MVERSVRYRTKPKKCSISGSQHGNDSQFLPEQIRYQGKALAQRIMGME